MKKPKYNILTPYSGTIGGFVFQKNGNIRIKKVIKTKSNENK